MQKFVFVLIAAIAAFALSACGGGGKSSSSAASPGAGGASPAASSAATSAASAAATSASSSAKMTKPAGGSVAMSSAMMQTGAKVYSTNCASCHQATGKGQPGVFPPLAGNPVVTGPPDKVVHIVKDGLSGKISVNGATYNGQMPAWKGTLSDNDIAAVVTYVRNSWGNKASPVTPAEVSKVK